MSIWRDYKKKVASLTLRERVLITCVGLALFIFPCYLSVYDTNARKIKDLEQKISNVRIDMDAADAETTAWQIRLTQNPNDVLKEQIAKYEERIASLDSKIGQATVNLIDAKEMVTVLSSVLNTSSAIKVLSMESMQPVQLIKKGNASLYQHGIKIKLRGRYLDILNHLQNLENMNYKFYWHSLNYSVDEYPYANVEIELYTLSISKDFIRG